jgi:hypothetical protein
MPYQSVAVGVLAVPSPFVSPFFESSLKEVKYTLLPWPFDNCDEVWITMEPLLRNFRTTLLPRVRVNPDQIS